MIEPADALLVSVSPGEIRIALIEDGRLAELWIDRDADRSRVGEVWRGRVGKVDAALQAAFVDLGEGGAGFLGFESGGARVSEGDAVRVQVVRDAQDGKALGLRSRVELGGRLVVFSPEAGDAAVSRRIPSARERERLRAILAAAARPGEGWLARTAAAGADAAEILDEVESLRAEVAGWSSRQKLPGLLYREPGAVSRALRDLCYAEMTAILVDDGPTLTAAQAFARRHWPELGRLIRRHDGPEPLLARIDEELAGALASRLALAGGGAITFDTTAAMTVVDVDFGGAAAAGRRTPLDVNLAAADEIARQIRLRDIGGLVVIDFIRMRERADRDRLVAALGEAVAADRLPVQVMGMTRAGLVEVMRPRGRTPLRSLMERACATCGGTGMTPAPEAAALEGVRQALSAAATMPGRPPVLACAPDVARALDGPVAAALAAAAERLGGPLRIETDAALAPGSVAIRAAG